MTALKKSLCVLLCLVTCLFGSSFSAEAAESDIMPLLDYTDFVLSSFGISNNKATVSISCSGSDSVTKITAETCLQRKFGLIWTKVDIGTANNVWKDSTTKSYLNAEHTATLSKSATYRCKTVFKVYSGSKSESITLYSNTASY